MKRKKLRLCSDESTEQELGAYNPNSPSFEDFIAKVVVPYLSFVEERPGWPNMPTEILARHFMTDKELMRELVRIHGESENFNDFENGVIFLITKRFEKAAENLPALEGEILVNASWYAFSYFNLCRYFWERLNDVEDD